jgi:hypothetical protein
VWWLHKPAASCKTWRSMYQSGATPCHWIWAARAAARLAATYLQTQVSTARHSTAQHRAAQRSSGATSISEALGPECCRM